MAGQGSYGLFDVVDLTNQETESSPRNRAVNTLQIHHTAYPSDSGSRALMDEGGRTVSANALLLMAAVLMEVVLAARRAFTSASAFDHQSFTVEVVNQSGGPEWRISQQQRIRLARLAVDLYKMGWLGSLTRAHIIGHSEVPGSYATACPGPDMQLDHIVWLANEIYAGRDPEAPPVPEIPKGTRNMTDYTIVYHHPTGVGVLLNTSSLLSKGIESGADRDLIMRLLWGKLDGPNGVTGRTMMPYTPETMTPAEITMVTDKYLKPLRAGVSATVDQATVKSAVLAALATAKVTISDAQYDALVSAGGLDEGQVALQVVEAITDAGVELSVEAAQDIARAVNDEFASRLQVAA